MAEKSSTTCSSSFFEVGEIRPARDSDFQHFIELVDGGGWTKKLDKNGVVAWTRNMENTSIKMYKLHTVFMGVSAGTAFDVVMDQDYRPTWDDASIRDFDICKLDGCNDIGYYALKCPAPLTNRDYVSQRSWRVVPGQYYIVFNHSVSHKKQPPLKHFIRGVSYVTGFLIRPSSEGSSLTYITQSDPKGKIPKWVINFALHKLAPKIIQKLNAACLKYTEWKESNNPEFKPWLNPEQNTLPLYSFEDPVLSSVEDSVIRETEDVKILNTVPEGMEAYETMDTNEEIVAINGVSNAST